MALQAYYTLLKQNEPIKQTNKQKTPKVSPFSTVTYPFTPRPINHVEDFKRRIRQPRLSLPETPAEQQVSYYVNTIADCVQKLNDDYDLKKRDFVNEVILDEVIDNLDGEEIDALLFGNTVRFRARLSRVNTNVQKTRRQKMFSFLDRQGALKCPFGEETHKFSKKFTELLTTLIQNFDFYIRNYSLTKKVRNFFRSEDSKDKLRKKFSLLQKRYNAELSKADFTKMMVYNHEPSSPPIYFEVRRNMCKSLVYLQDIVKNVSIIPLRSLSAFLQHLFNAVRRGKDNGTLSDRRDTLEKVVSILKRMVESYGNVRLIELAEDQNAFGVFTHNPINTSKRSRGVDLNELGKMWASLEEDYKDLSNSVMQKRPNIG
jgi:hypothetical protein